MRMALVVDDLQGLAHLDDRGGLAGASGARDDQSAAAGLGMPVEIRQPSALQDCGADHRGRDRQEPGMVGQARFVVVLAGIRGQSPPVGRFKQRGRFDGVRGERPPAGERGQLPVFAWLAAGRLAHSGLAGVHQRFFASW
jgi:hypothetical protein